MGAIQSPYKFKNNKILLCFLFITLVSVSNAGTCKEGCPTPNRSTKYTYTPGSVYQYNLESVVTIYLSGNDAQETTIKVLGGAKLFALNNCGYILKLDKLQITNPNGKNNVLPPEYLKPVRFTMTNDELLPEICAELNDNEFSLNVKRAIISMIQSSDSKNFETDVFGTCPTVFTSNTNGKNVIVNKIRNLNACNHRESIVSGFITSVINENSGVKSTPLLNGDYTNEQRIKNGILDSVIINEEYNFMPFSAGDAGVRAKVVTRLNFATKTQGTAPKVSTPTPRTIIFENVTPQPVPTIFNNLQTALKNTVQSYENNVGSRSARLFTELIRLMRLTKRDDLTMLHQQIRAHENVELSTKIYFDALFRAGTGDSVDAAANLIKKMNDKEKKLFYLSLNFVQSVTQESLVSINKLLDGNVPAEAYLGVGKLVSQYCAKHSCDSKEVKTIIEKFVTKLGNCKGENRHQEDTIIAVLKGLKNTNNLINPALDKVILCTSEKSSSRIRVAALQTLVAAGCNKKAETVPLNLLKNRNEDSEIRIEAYLSVISCPTGQLANEIKTLLDDETVYQVGSYITSHLASLRSSTDPSRRDARHHFSNIRTTKKFPTDFRRFSFNREISYGVDSMGLGGSLDTNVIYSQRSFLPRSASLNFTGELFGNAFNIFEVKGRQENLDQMVESYFGPKGFFNTGTKQSIYDKMVSYYNLAKEQGQKRFRARRDIKDDVNAFSRAVSMGNDVYSDLDVDLSVKMFGSEMFFLSLGENALSNPKEFISKFFEHMDKGINNMKDSSYTLESHGLFLDTDLVYPTGVGFPLKFSVQGTGVVRVETSIQADIKEITKNPKNTNVSLKLVPSANYQISGTLSVDAHLVSAGIQVSGSVHSSTGANIKLTLTDGRGLDVNLGLPLKKQEIFNFEHKTVFISQERGAETVETPLKFSSKKKNFSGCFEQLNKFIGVTFCTDGSLTTPGTLNVAPFPLNGNNKFTVWLDVDSAYSFKIFADDKNPSKQSILFAFDTPGSKTNRKTELKLELGLEEGKSLYGRAELSSPIRNGAVEVGIKNDQKELIFYLEGLDGQEKHLAKIGVTKVGNGNQQEYTPIALYTAPNKNNDNFFGYSVKGKIISEKYKKDGTKFIFSNIQIAYEKIEPLLINGYIAQQSLHFETELTFARASNKGTFKGDIEILGPNKKFDISFTSNFKNVYNGRIQADILHTPKDYRQNLVIVYGNDLNSQRDRIEYHGYNTETGENDGKLISFGSDFRAPFIPFNIKQDTVAGKNRFDYKIESSYSKHRLNANVNGKSSKGTHDVNIGASFNAHGFKFISTRRPIDNQKYQFNNKFQTNSGIQFELNGAVGHGSNVDVNIEGIFVLGDKQEQNKFTIVVLTTPKQTLTNGKILIGKTEFMSFDVTINKGDNTNGKIELKMKDVLAGKGDFKSTKGKGDGNFLINFIKVGRKIKTDVKFNIAAPIYDFSTDFYYDFENDNTKKVSYSTVTRVESSKFDSKNNLEIFTEKYMFNILGGKQGTYNDGSMKGKFILTLPTGRSLGGEINREIHMKSDNANGHIDVKFEDRLPNKKTRSLIMNRKLTSADLRSKLFDVTDKITYNDFDNKNFIIDSHIKHYPKGQYKGASVNLGVKGSLLPEPINFILTIDEYSNEHADYSINGNYGKLVNGDIKGKYHIGGRSKPALYDILFTLTAPQTKIDTIKFSSSGSLLKPDTDGGIYEFKLKTNAEMGPRKFDINTEVTGNANNGKAKFSGRIGDQDPIDATLSFTHIDKEESKQLSGAVKLEFGQNKIVTLSGEILTAGNNEITIHCKLQTPFERYQNTEVNFNTVRRNEESYITNAKLVSEDKAFTWDSKIVLSDRYPSVDITFVLPQKTVRLYTSLQHLGERKYKGEVIVKNFIDFNFDGAGEVSYQNLESFYVKLDADSDTLKLNKFHLEITSKAGSNGKGIEFKASTDNKNILQGSADFTVKEEKGKTVIEGQGSVKLYDKQRAANFNLIRNHFDATKDGETGFMYVFNGNLGPQKIVSELKVTDKNFLSKYTLCEEKKQCMNIEIRSVLKKVDMHNLNHEFFVSVDLRELGYANEFSLTAVTIAENNKYDHTVDLLVQSNEKKNYQYKIYSHPDENGVILTLPTRVIAIETVTQIPKEIFGQYNIGLIIYLDKKNQPNNKATIGLTGDLSRPSRTNINYYGDFKVQHPSIRPLVISGSGEINGERKYSTGKIEIDIFKNENQKIIANGRYGNTDLSGKGFNITSELSLHSKGLNIDYNYNSHAALSFDRRQFSSGYLISSPLDELKFSTYLFGSDELFVFVVSGFNDELLNLNAKFDFNKLEASFNSKVKYLKGEPLVISGKSSGFSSLTFNMNRGKLLNVDGEVTLGKQVRLVIIGPTKEIFNGKIALDHGHFLNSEYKVHDVEAKEFLKAFQDTLKADYENAKNELGERIVKVQTSMKNRNEAVQDALPDLTNLRNEYKREVKKLSDELMADKTVKALFEIIQYLFLTFEDVLNKIVPIIVDTCKKIADTIDHFNKFLIDLLQQRIVPIVKELLTKCEEIFAQIYTDTINIVSGVMERTVKALKVFEDDFNKIAKVIGDMFKNFTNIFTSTLSALKKELTELYNSIVQQIKSCPTFEQFKEQYQQFFKEYKVPEYAIALIKEFTSLLEYCSPTIEAAEFFQQITKYIEMKLTKPETVNDGDEIRNLYDYLIRALRSIINMVKTPTTEQQQGIFTPIPFTFDSFKHIPILTNFKLSAFNYFKNEQPLSIREIFTTYRPYGFDLKELYPPFTMHARIADGSHIFTFDGKHLTFPGSCQYILAQDFVNNNFSIVATLLNGKMKSVTLVSKGETLELNNEGIVKYNDKQQDLPAHGQDIFSYRKFYTTTLLTTYGAEIKCSIDLRVCHFTVSGFYLGKLRGLLGNGNGEPFDDYTLPNGKVTLNFADFGNAYKSSKGNCPAVPFVDHEQHAHHHSELCDELFSGDSNLRLCYYFIDPHNYREACEHAVATATDKEDAACNIADVYTSACVKEKIPVHIPSKCKKCLNNNNEKLDIGTEFSVKVPQKQADIVIVVDTSIGPLMGELVQGIINALRTELKARQILDTNVIVIGYNKNHKYTYLLSTNGKLNYSGKLGLAKLDGPHVEKPLVTGCEEIDHYLAMAHEKHNQLKEDLGLTADAQAFQSAISYPFRATASKVILAVRNDNLNYSSNPTKYLGALYAYDSAVKQGITLHVITPVNDLVVVGKDSKQLKQIVGFNANTVLLHTDKKKTEMGSVDLRKNIKYDSDLGIGFVESSNGYVFVLQHYIALKKDIRKNYITVLTNALADQISRTETTSNCVCKLSRGLYPEEKCTAIESILVKKATAQRG